LIGLESIINYAFNDRLSLISGIAFENEALAEGFSITHSASPTEHPSTPHSPNMENDHIVSAYMQAQYQLLRIIQLSAGARYDNSSVYNEVLTPRMSIIYNRNNLTAKLLYMEAFRAPKPWDYNWGAGNRGLQPEKMRSWEVFFAYNFIKNFRGEISLYRNNTYNILYQSSSLNMWVNQGILITDGVELTLNYYTHELRPYINYTYNYSHFNQQNSQIPEIAHHSANLGLQYIITNKIKFNLSGNYLGSRKNPQIIPTTGDNKVDPALVLNSVLTYSGPNNLNFQLIIKNLLDTKYYHTSNVTDPSYSVSRFRQAQRTILFRIIWQIKV